MRYTSALRAARSVPTSAAQEPQSDPATSDPKAEATTVEPEVRDRRLALVSGIAGAELQRLTERVRGRQAARNGGEGCQRLAGGAVDCGCDYCSAFWAEVERRLNGNRR